jgi:hypothetical protein
MKRSVTYTSTAADTGPIQSAVVDESLTTGDLNRVCDIGIGIVLIMIR